MSKQTDFNFGWNENNETTPTYDPADYFEGYETPQWQNMAESEVWTLVAEIQKRNKEITDFVRKFTEEKHPMLSRTAPANDRQQQGGGPKRLANEMLGRTPKEFIIKSVRQITGQYGLQLSIKGALEGESVLWYVSHSKPGRENPVFEALMNHLGEQENDWVEQTVYLHLEQDPHDEKWYQRVTFETVDAPAPTNEAPKPPAAGSRRR